MNKTAVIGGSESFRLFLKSIDKNIVFEEDLNKAITNYEYTSIIILPEYDKGIEFIKPFSTDIIETLAKRKKEGFKIYIENYCSYNFYDSSLFGARVMGKICHVQTETLYLEKGLRYITNGEIILQAQDAAYLPCLPSSSDPYAKSHDVLISLGRFLGTTHPAPQNDKKSFPVLIKTGSFYTSLISISNFNPLDFKPNYRWKKILTNIFTFLLDAEPQKIEEAYDQIYPSLKIRMDVNSDFDDRNIKQYLEEAVSRAINWHFDSGIIFDKSGKNGSFEMIMSSMNHDIYANKRVESGMYTGWLLTEAGKYFNHTDWSETGKNLFDFFLSNGQIESGKYKGLFNFYFNENSGPCDIYSLDCGRDGIAMCNMYRLTKDESLLPKIKNLADAFINLTDDDLLRTRYIDYKNYIKNEHTYKETYESARTPAACMEMTSFMIMASRILGDKKYLENTLKIADRIYNDFPNYDYYGHTTSSRYARLLFLLLCVQMTGERDYSDVINNVIDYLYNLKLPCGGIYSEDNLTFEKYGTSENEAGITTVWENDKISDQLYCVNNTLMALSLIKMLPENTTVNKEKALELQKSLFKYLVKIQIVDEDKRFNGGWMRAFSMTHGEYYGLNLDTFWGPYCIMAGWIMGIIPLSFLSELTDESFYI